jgi:hypothetical protein
MKVETCSFAAPRKKQTVSQLQQTMDQMQAKNPSPESYTHGAEAQPPLATTLDIDSNLNGCYSELAELIGSVFASARAGMQGQDSETLRHVRVQELERQAQSLHAQMMQDDIATAATHNHLTIAAQQVAATWQQQALLQQQMAQSLQGGGLPADVGLPQQLLPQVPLQPQPLSPNLPGAATVPWMLSPELARPSGNLQWAGAVPWAPPGLGADSAAWSPEHVLSGQNASIMAGDGPPGVLKASGSSSGSSNGNNSSKLAAASGNRGKGKGRRAGDHLDGAGSQLVGAGSIGRLPTQSKASKSSGSSNELTNSPNDHGGKGGKAQTGKGPGKAAAMQSSGQERNGAGESAAAAAIDQTLPNNLRELENVQAERILVVRKINRLGFESAKILESHFMKHGNVERVLVAHSNGKNTRDGKFRLRTSSFGFVVMCTAADAEASLDAGAEQLVRCPNAKDGISVQVQRFRRVDSRV